MKDIKLFINEALSKMDYSEVLKLVKSEDKIKEYTKNIHSKSDVLFIVPIESTKIMFKSGEAKVYAVGINDFSSKRVKNISYYVSVFYAFIGNRYQIKSINDEKEFIEANKRKQDFSIDNIHNEIQEYLTKK